jgi:hypothetical protein
LLFGINALREDEREVQKEEYVVPSLANTGTNCRLGFQGYCFMMYLEHEAFRGSRSGVNT